MFNVHALLRNAQPLDRHSSNVVLKHKMGANFKPNGDRVSSEQIQRRLNSSKGLPNLRMPEHKPVAPPSHRSCWHKILDDRRGRTAGHTLGKPAPTDNGNRVCCSIIGTLFDIDGASRSSNRYLEQ